MALIFHIKDPQLSPTKDGAMGALIVVLGLYGIIGMLATVTGACLNPNIGFVTIIFNIIMAGPGDEIYIRYMPSYVIGPILGGIAGAYLTKFSLLT